MDSNEKYYLGEFYSPLRLNTKRGTKIRENSVLITFLKTQKSIRYNLLKESALNLAVIPNNILNTFLEHGYIHCVDRPDAFAITAIGVWRYEVDCNILSENKLLGYFNNEYFFPKEDTDLDDREKIILLSMIATRAFSESSAVDMKKNDEIKDRWSKVLLMSFDFLSSYGLIDKLKKDALLDSRGNIHPVSSLFRHNNDIIPKVFGYYAYDRKEKYFLEVGANSTLAKDKLGFLFWKIFKGTLSQEGVNHVLEYCNEVSNTESIYLFYSSTHLFHLPKYDTLLKDALLHSIMNKSLWEKNT